MEFPCIVTSLECLACRGCCAFAHSGGDWSPRLTPEDISLLKKVSSDQAWLEGQKRVALVPSVRGQACFFLDEASHHCRVYPSRPYECRFYPFLLSHEDGVVRVYAHLSCPALGETLKKNDWRRSVSGVRVFFQQDTTLLWVRENAQHLVDYRPFLNEMKYLFDVGLVDDGARLLKIKPRLDQALAQRKNSCSALHFSQIFSWKDAFTFDVIDVADNTLVFARQPIGTFLYWPPLGERIHMDAVERAFSIMQEENGASGISRIENVSEADLAVFEGKRFVKRVRGHEYIYRKADIAGLAGKKYHSKRHEINQLLHVRHLEYRPFELSDGEACRILFEQWLDARRMKYDDEVYRALLSENLAVHKGIFSHAPALGLIGRVVLIDGKVKAYTFGYPLSEGVFCVFLEVADPSVTGLASFIFREFAADAALKEFDLINAMDDFGMPQVASAKSHWHPSALAPVYTVSWVSALSGKKISE